MNYFLMKEEENYFSISLNDDNEYELVQLDSELVPENLNAQFFKDNGFQVGNKEGFIPLVSFEDFLSKCGNFSLLKWTEENNEEENFYIELNAIPTPKVIDFELYNFKLHNIEGIKNIVFDEKSQNLKMQFSLDGGNNWLKFDNEKEPVNINDTQWVSDKDTFIEQNEVIELNNFEDLFIPTKNIAYANQKKLDMRLKFDDLNQIFSTVRFNFYTSFNKK